MNEYLRELKEQFFRSTGIIVDFDSKLNIREFTRWLELRQRIGEEYSTLLTDLGFDYQISSCAETDKGRLDSIVKPYETTIITPYSSFDGISNQRIIKGRMEVYRGVPLKATKYKDRMEIERIETSLIDTYITQNPFRPEFVKGWEDLHNSSIYNIICGVYGTLYDDDIQKKIDALTVLKSKLQDEYIESYETHKDNYFYVIGSKRKIKKLDKTLK